LRDAFHLPPTRIGRPEVPLHVVQQARHLTQEVIVRGEVEEGGFGCAEIAHRAFEPRPVTREVAPTLGGVPRSLQVASDRISEHSGVVGATTVAVRSVVPDHPRTAEEVS
jgi:hypothetical protein